LWLVFDRYRLAAGGTMNWEGFAVGHETILPGLLALWCGTVSSAKASERDVALCVVCIVCAAIVILSVWAL
jgi:hypothetical protein